MDMEQKNGGLGSVGFTNHECFHFMSWFVVHEICDAAGAGHASTVA